MKVTGVIRKSLKSLTSIGDNFNQKDEQGNIRKSISSIANRFLPRFHDTMKEKTSSNKEQNAIKKQNIERKCPYTECDSKGNTDTKSKNKKHLILEHCPTYQKISNNTENDGQKTENRNKEIARLFQSEIVDEQLNPGQYENIIKKSNEQNIKVLENSSNYLNEENDSIIFDGQFNVQPSEENKNKTSFVVDYKTKSEDRVKNEQTNNVLENSSNYLNEENDSIIFDGQFNVQPSEENKNKTSFVVDYKTKSEDRVKNEQTNNVLENSSNYLNEENDSVIFQEQFNLRSMEASNKNSIEQIDNVLGNSSSYLNEGKNSVIIGHDDFILYSNSDSLLLDEVFINDPNSSFSNVDNLDESLKAEIKSFFSRIILLLNDFFKNSK